MEAQTESEIESIDVANDDLIDVLAQVVQYEKTRGASGANPRLAVVGDGPHKMAMPTRTNNVVEDTVIYGNELVSDGAVADTVTIDGSDVAVNVL